MVSKTKHYLSAGICMLIFLVNYSSAQPSNPGGIPLDRIPSHDVLNRVEQLSLDNKSKALEIVNKAYGLEQSAAFENVEGFFLEIDHWIYNERNVVRHNDTSWKENPFFENIYGFWDFTNNRYWEAYTSQSPGGFQFASETIFRNNTDYTVFPTRKSYRKSPLLPDQYHGVMAHAYHAWLDLIPARLLFIMKKQPYSLTYLGKQEVGNQTVDVVEFTWPSSSKRPRLYFLESGEIFAAGSNHANTWNGDLANMVFYGERKEKDGFLVPKEVIVHFDEKNILHRRIKDFGIAQADGSLFEIDDSFSLIKDQWVSVELSASVKGFEDLVQYYQDNFYYIEFNEFIAAFNAPRHPAITRTLINSIKQKTGKSVNYVIVSHAHEVPLAGLRPFLEEGATVITTKNTEHIINEIASAPASSFGAPFFGAPVKDVKMEFVSEKRPFIIKDDQTKVEVMNIGNTSHAEGNLIAYNKKENVLLQGGLYSYEGKLSSTEIYFINWLKKKKMETTLIVGFNHSPIVAKDLSQEKSNVDATMSLFHEKLKKIKKN